MSLHAIGGMNLYAVIDLVDQTRREPSKGLRICPYAMLPQGVGKLAW